MARSRPSDGNLGDFEEEEEELACLVYGCGSPREEDDGEYRFCHYHNQDREQAENQPFGPPEKPLVEDGSEEN